MSKCQCIDLERLAEIFKALGNQHRLRILAGLSACCTSGVQCCGGPGKRSMGEMGGELEIVASTLSHHIKELSRAGLLSCDKHGKSVLCCTDRATLRSLSALFAALAGDAELPDDWLTSTDPTTKE
jgi:ArsR family transcriptional regulator, arsenate/arsenite/antimonite-responsive transcriptional repressor